MKNITEFETYNFYCQLKDLVPCRLSSLKEYLFYRNKFLNRGAYVK